jgi:hypothetical protein
MITPPCRMVRLSATVEDDDEIDVSIDPLVGIGGWQDDKGRMLFDYLIMDDHDIMLRSACLDSVLLDQVIRAEWPPDKDAVRMATSISGFMAWLRPKQETFQASWDRGNAGRDG